MSFDVPLFPEAAPVSDFQIVDGRTVTAYQHGMQRAAITLGEGNGDGHAAPGESFAVLLPEGGSLRAAELFTNDECVDNSARIPDSWSDSVSVKYSLPAIRAGCEPGHVVHALARIVIPETPVRVEYALTEKGRALERALAEIGKWAERWGAAEPTRSAGASPPRDSATPRPRRAARSRSARPGRPASA